MAKKKAAQPDQESDSEDESVETDYSCPDKAAKKRRRRAVPDPAKTAKAAKLSVPAARAERDAAAKVASDDRASGNRQLSAKAGGILTGNQHLGMSYPASGRAPSVGIFAALRPLVPATVPAPVGWER